MNNNILHTGVAIGFGMCLMALFSQPNAQANLPIMSMGYGQNPLTSIGGTAYDGENKFLMTAPSNFDLIITDVILTSTTNVLCNRNQQLHLQWKLCHLRQPWCALYGFGLLCDSNLVDR